jgi:hypothetical protein
MKVENIVIDISKKKATIIDFGLYTNLSTDKFTGLGYAQQPPEYILYNIVYSISYFIYYIRKKKKS